MTGFTRERLVGLFAMDRHGVRFRHDVDYDPVCALEMAELEADCGVHADYYIRIRGPYNPFSDDLQQILHTILLLGHRLGVHVDLGLPRDAETPEWLLERATTRDYRLLSSEYPVDRIVSFHAPPRSVYWRHVPGYTHALTIRWKDRTVTDSRGIWHGDPEAMIADGGLVSLNLHPEWWMWPQDKADEWRIIEAGKP